MFGAVEPPRTDSKLPFRPASPFITVVRGGSMWLNHPKIARNCPVVLLPLQESGSRRFGVVEPPRTHVLHDSGSKRFGVVEPPQAYSNLPCRPASPFVTVVPGGSVWSNRYKLTRWFNLTEPPRTTVTKGDAGIQGRFEYTQPTRTTVTKGEAGLQGTLE